MGTGLLVGLRNVVPGVDARSAAVQSVFDAVRECEVAQAYAVFCGIDVGKGEHHAVVLDTNGKRLFDKAVPNDESRLRAVFDQLASHGPLLIVVDQPNIIGALPVTVARAYGHDVAYLRSVDAPHT